MKTKTLSLAMLALFVSCSKIESPADSLPVTDEEFKGEVDAKRIRFDVADLNVVKTRAASTLTEASISELMVIDVMNNEVLQSVKQTSSDTDFGAPSIDLKYGTHTLYFIAHRSEGVAYDLESLLMTATKVKDTYVKTLTLNVTTTTDKNQTVALDRANYRLMCYVQDKIPATATTMKISVDKYYPNLSLTNFAGLGEKVQTTTLDITSLVGQTGTSVNMYGFSKEWQKEYAANVTITVLDADGTILASHSKSNVPLETAYTTKISGEYFASSSTLTVTVNTDYEGTKDVEL